MPKLMRTKSTAGEGVTLRCSDCDQVFSPPVPRGARPWTPDEAIAILASEFRDHVEKVHRSLRPSSVKGSDVIPAEGVVRK
jgi:hypothetical protein